MITYKIKDVRKSTNDQLLDNTNWDINDLKFIVFEYLIPRAMGTPLKRYSKIHCLNKSDAVGKLGLKYTIYNYIACFATGSLPFTSEKMKESKQRNTIGIDITNQIQSSISLKDIEKGNLQLTFPLFANGFTQMDEELKTTLITNFNKLKTSNKIVSNPLVGYVIHNGHHFFYVGLSKKEIANQDVIKQKLKKNLFFTTKFKFVNMDNEHTELAQLLLKDGTLLEMDEEV